MSQSGKYRIQRNHLPPDVNVFDGEVSHVHGNGKAQLRTQKCS